MFLAFSVFLLCLYAVERLFIRLLVIESARFEDDRIQKMSIHVETDRKVTFQAVFRIWIDLDD